MTGKLSEVLFSLQLEHKLFPGGGFRIKLDTSSLFEDWNSEDCSDKLRDFEVKLNNFINKNDFLLEFRGKSKLPNLW
jgi:hypothetical protein